MGCTSLELWQCSLDHPHPEDVSPQGLLFWKWRVQCNSAWLCWVLECSIPLCKMFAHVPGVLEIPVVSSLIHQHCLKVNGCYFVDLGSASARSGKPSRAEQPRAGANTIWQADNADGSQQSLNSGAVVWQHTSLNLWLALQDHMCLSHMARSIDPLWIGFWYRFVLHLLFKLAWSESVRFQLSRWSCSASDQLLSVSLVQA